MADLLEGYRVLDLAEEGAMLCARILGDLGADIVKVEPPNGAPSRNLGPFYTGVPHPERSLFWFSYNYNKRGITLDIQTQDGRKLFKELVKSAHFVTESFPPGYMDSIGFGYSNLSKINPGIVMVSMTGFGQTGPYASYKAPDTVAMAMGGFTFTCGDPDRPPISISYRQQATLHAGADGAVGALLAHYYREMSGRGQQVDVSTQQSVMWTLFSTVSHWDLIKFNVERTGGTFTSPRTGTVTKYIWPCKDGYITFEIRFAAVTGKGLASLFEWIAEGDMLDPRLRDISTERDSFDIDAMSQETADLLSACMADFFLAHTKDELFSGAQKHGIMLFPVTTVADVFHDPQLKEREFFNVVDHPELGNNISYPGPFAKLEPREIEIRRRAPLIGEHNLEIYQGELGLSAEDLALLKQSRVI